MKRVVWGLFVILLLLLALVVMQFQVANPELVVVRTLIGDIPQVALGNALLWALLSGFVLGLLVGGVLWQLKVLENRWLRHQLKKSQLNKKTDLAKAPALPEATA